uniref:MFS_1_like domain-containing protein n=1 Tax=Ascaris lumbricoides TaxID=6252 RepID=A0A0M3IA21_ASCLU
LYELVAQTPGASEFFAQRWLYPLKVIIGRIIINVAMGTGFLSFGLVKTRIWIKPLLSIYFFAHIIAMIVWPIVYTFLKRILPRKKFGKEGKMAKKVDNEEFKLKRCNGIRIAQLFVFMRFCKFTFAECIM